MNRTPQSTIKRKTTHSKKKKNKLNIELLYKSAIPTLTYLPKKIENQYSNKYVPTHIYSSTILL